MRRMLATVIAAGVLAGYACQAPETPAVSSSEPTERSERIGWRSEVGIEAALGYVLNECVDPVALRSSFAEFGQPYGLSPRDVAESALWGVLHHRDRLDTADNPMLETYLDSMIDVHGERIVETLDILFGEGDYDQLMHWYIYGPMKRQLYVDNVDEFRDRVDGALSFASFFTDLDQVYEDLRAARGYMRY